MGHPRPGKKMSQQGLCGDVLSTTKGCAVTPFLIAKIIFCAARVLANANSGVSRNQPNTWQVQRALGLSAAESIFIIEIIWLRPQGMASRLGWMLALRLRRGAWRGA